MHEESPIRSEDHEAAPPSVKAIAIGLAVDLLANSGAALVLAVFVGVVVGHPGSIERAFNAPLTQASLALIGLLSTALAGYVTAAVAGRREVLHGLCLGVVEVSIAVPILVRPVHVGQARVRSSPP